MGGWVQPDAADLSKESPFRAAALMMVCWQCVSQKHTNTHIALNSLVIVLHLSCCIEVLGLTNTVRAGIRAEQSRTEAQEETHTDETHCCC
jgi:hypothetical protein